MLQSIIYSELNKKDLEENFISLEEELAKFISTPTSVVLSVDNNIISLRQFENVIPNLYSYIVEGNRVGKIKEDVKRMKEHLQTMGENNVKLEAQFYTKDNESDKRFYQAMNIFVDDSSGQFKDSSTTTSGRSHPQSITISQPTDVSSITMSEVGTIHESIARANINVSRSIGNISGLKRKPVEIDEYTIEAPPPSAPSDRLSSLAPDDAATDSNDAIARLSMPLLRDYEVNRSQRGIWLFHKYAPRMILKIILVLATFVTCFKVTMVHGRRGAPTGEKDAPEGRAEQVLQCARVLSEGSGLSSKQRNNTAQWNAVNWFLDGGGVGIEVPDTDACSWSTNFGIAYGLIVLRESLGVLDPSWHSQLHGMDILEQICRWKRITCDVDKTTIQRLTMNHGGLSGTIPKELMGFADLDSLQIENNRLVGTIPSELGKLTKLEYLLLQQTQLSGTIPTTLGRLTALKQLLLDHTDLSGDMPMEICELRKTSLQFLTSDCTEKWDDSNFVHCDRTSCCTYCG